MTPISYDYIMEYMTKWEHSLACYDVAKIAQQNLIRLDDLID